MEVGWSLRWKFSYGRSLVKLKGDFGNLGGGILTYGCYKVGNR
jgi:hypothetical protein